MIQILLWAPLAAGLVACAMPQRLVGWVATLGSLATLVLAIVVVAGFDPSGGLQHPVDDSWIPSLGVRYQLGVDGISLFLVLLTAVLWFASTLWSAINTPERPRTYFLMFGLAETAVLGAFLAQDLILFILFFDLMLIPFYFLFGSWGTEHPGRPEEDEGPIRPQPAVIKMIVYTLVGSFLMLAGGIATGIIAAHGGPINFNIAYLAGHPLGTGSQYWIFWFFAAAFLVKMPAFPLHAWMADAYRVAPLPALALFSGVLSKVGAYGFLRIVLPIFPAATNHFQEVILVIAVASILYGSVMAFTQTSARLILGYSSVAQLGFITLGIFSLRPDGADGAVLQMVNHGLVIAPLMLIAVLLVARAGTDDITKMGGLAMRAPVLAALFLIATMALLAIPGSSNFIGEFYILNGIFQEKIVYAFIAAIGIALSAYYALRLYQHAMHNRKPDGIESREVGLLDGTVITGLVACVVALALYPGLILHRAEHSTSAAVANTNCLIGSYSNRESTTTASSCNNVVAER
ncbi:MAG TPA: NADH-quinone oxidoreductase subunit M [Solirubrobacterales bacterium]|nr:NADH-quinone oxidoreductase subunit M [Solirubrobacterales bacterium]